MFVFFSLFFLFSCFILFEIFYSSVRDWIKILKIDDKNNNNASRNKDNHIFHGISLIKKYSDIILIG